MITLISLSTDVTAYSTRILSAYLRGKGLNTRLIFLPNVEFESHDAIPDAVPYDKNTINQVIDLCKGSSLIGISLFTSDFPNAIYLVKHIKNNLNIPVIFGGKHPSAKPEQSLLYADMVCIGEGEEALTELLQKIESRQDYYNTRNLWIKHNGAIIKNPNRSIIENLDSVPFPDYSCDDHYAWETGTDEIIRLTPEILKKYMFPEGNTGLIPYKTLFSRGCPFSCTYCYSFKKMYKGQKYLRFRSIENIIQELELIKKNLPYIQMVELLDDNIFALSLEKIDEFCHTYKRRIWLPMYFTGHPKDITEDKLSRFINAGLIITCMGVQTGSKQTKKLYKRNVPDETILKAVHAVHKFKNSLVASEYDVILDNPYETNENLVETIRLLLKFPKPRHFKLFSLTFFPGTELYEKAKQDGILSEEDEFNEYKKNYFGFLYRKRKYLNFIFLFLNQNVPDFIIKILINKHVISLFDRPLINEFLFRTLTSLKKFREKRRGKRRIFGNVIKPVLLK
ncbi:MAG: cobalamin B12-binding domain-containing protein [Planctomycetes bacterium]|nr:cobalamin B12-binding domain-containing protein [Planctomycetota bacterium]